jgi:hypothetical protein
MCINERIGVRTSDTMGSLSSPGETSIHVFSTAAGSPGEHGVQ